MWGLSCPEPDYCSGTMCSGEDQALNEGRMIPSCSMCSNSCLATWRHSNVRRRGRAEAGGPVVSDVMHDGREQT